MITQFVDYLSSKIRPYSRWLVLALLVLAAVLWIRNYSEWFPDAAQEADQTLNHMVERDPNVREVLALYHDHRNQHALRMAALSAKGHPNPESILRDMARDAQVTRQMPYQARLAALIEDKNLTMDREKREAFLMTHATTCQTLFAASDPTMVNDYLIYLEQAASEPHIWQLVWDDPVALL